jgi:hypothetical protein
VREGVVLATTSLFLLPLLPEIELVSIGSNTNYGNTLLCITAKIHYIISGFEPIKDRVNGFTRRHEVALCKDNEPLSHVCYSAKRRLSLI